MRAAGSINAIQRPPAAVTADGTDQRVARSARPPDARHLFAEIGQQPGDGGLADPQRGLECGRGERPTLAQQVQQLFGVAVGVQGPV